VDTVSVVLLGVIAVASLAQALSLVAVALAGRDIARRVGRFEQTLEREIQPSLREAARLTRGLAGASEATVSQAYRLAGLVDSVAASVIGTRAALTEALLPAAARAASLLSVFRAVLALLNLPRPRRP
jgi:hypothetical protein